MIDLKQRELDKAFLDGADAADHAISQALRGELSPDGLGARIINGVGVGERQAQ